MAIRQTLESVKTDEKQREIAHNVSLLNSIRLLYDVAVSLGIVQRNEAVYQPDVRIVNETHDVLNETKTEKLVKLPTMVTDDLSVSTDTLDVVAYMAAMIVLAARRLVKKKKRFLP